MSAVTDRERFLSALYTAPLLPADAIIVLCGEDGDERGTAALELLRQGAAHTVVCSGALDDPPRRHGAERVAQQLMAAGLAPDRIKVEVGSRNTHEQAVNVVEIAVVNDWHRLLIVASNYHLPRAMLTFIKAIGEQPIRLVPFATTHTSWWLTPRGVEAARLELLDSEFSKISEYGAHCASWSEGLDYLRRWDGL